MRGQQRQAEVLLVREFCEHLGLSACTIDSLDPPLPDTRIAYRTGDTEHEVYIELTDYQVDQLPESGSAARRIDAVGRRILDRTQAMLAAANEPASELELRATFDSNPPPPQSEVEELAKELASFLTHRFDGLCSRPTVFRRVCRDFKSYAGLDKRVESMIIHRVPNRKGPVHWHVNGTAHIAVVSSVLRERIQAKSPARQKYTIQSGKPCWLLVCASGQTCSDGAGTKVGQEAGLHAEEVQEVAAKAGFDRIYFWERVRKWHDLLWPPNGKYEHSQPPELRIRPMQPADFAAVRAVWEAAGLSTRPAGRDTEAAVRAQLEQWPDTYLVAECGGRVVGVVFGTHDGRKGWINRLAVHPDCQRRGVARRLMEACEQALHAQGIEIIAALIEGDNPVSEATFRAAGYEEFGPIKYFRKRWRPDI